MAEHATKQGDDFAREVLKGLTSSPKRLSSKYFYDDEGSRLFVEIMKLPEYYLTASEIEIFSDYTDKIFDAFNFTREPFDLIELGAGDGSKTSILIEKFISENSDFRYMPVDISNEALNDLTKTFRNRFNGLAIHPKEGDYSRTLTTLSDASDRRKIILFLGSNIGNFRGNQAIEFFKSLSRGMNDGDLLFIGFDLHKNPKTILKAYDDGSGITARFNLNLLKRINRELDADFDTGAFRHYASYHPIEKAARSFLISQKKQEVRIKALDRTICFDAWEPIYMEISQKYDIPAIESLARDSGFEVVENFFDSRKYYVDSLWRPIPGADIRAKI